ncbi:UNKNOWN [Stylonychia lemnae]|uniref:Acyltransferase 3 domain-containing protein n=1 Tax=Stylonychia lemnae TaxID=5949 RepID=A0A078A4R6_STYLE|nr:UNKNOWN [Stylonychia lemnae]|eukprot:CDW75759.1 UNKNOWN [Stylonychia lemnae]
MIGMKKLELDFIPKQIEQSFDMNADKSDDSNIKSNQLNLNNIEAQVSVIMNSEIIQEPGAIFAFKNYAFDELKKSRRKEGDHEELDMLEVFRLFSQLMIQMNATSFYLMTGPTFNNWKILDFFQQVIFTIVISGTIPMECFLFISAFLGSYRLLQVQEARGGYFTFKDALKLIGRKLARLIPLYYITLFFGWAVSSRFFEGPLYGISKKLYLNCDKYWWTQLIFIGNFFPFMGEATQGCMYWSWFVQADVQLYSLIPLYLYLYRKSKTIAIAIMIFLSLFGIFYNIFEVYRLQLRAGPFAIENFDLFAILFNKPYTKFQYHIPGVFFAIFYMELLRYRRASDEVKKEKYFIIHYFTKANWIGQVFLLVGQFLVVLTLFSNHEAVKDSYKWSTLENAMYFGFNRPAYMIGIILIYSAVVLGHFEGPRKLLNHDIIRAIGKLTYAIGLLCPIIINLALLGQESAYYLAFWSVIYLCIGNLVVLLICSFLVYLMIEYPCKRLVYGI